MSRLIVVPPVEVIESLVYPNATNAANTSHNIVLLMILQFMIVPLECPTKPVDHFVILCFYLSQVTDVVKGSVPSKVPLMPHHVVHC